MNGLRIVFAALLAIFAQCVFPAVAYAKWLKAETAHFILYSSGNEKDLRQTAIRLERFDALLKLKFNFQDKPHQPKLPIYYLPRQSDVVALTKGWQANVAGFFAARPEGSFAVANREKSQYQLQLDGDGILQHEYGHYFMFRHAAFPYPAWYVEGFAEFVSTTTIDADGNWTMGKPANHRAHSILNMDKISIEKLLFGRAREMSPAETSVFYGRSWLLTHMLLTDPAYNGQLATYFGSIAANKSQREAAIAGFGDLAALDKALDRYKTRKLAFINSRIPIQTDISVTITALDAMAEALLPLRLERLSASDISSVPARLEAVAQLFPGQAEPYYELAMAHRWLGSRAPGEQRDSHAAKAEAAIDRALAINPRHVRANVIKAEFVMRRLGAQQDRNPAHWTAAREYLITANRESSDDPMVLVGWYDSFGMQGRKPSQTARDGLARAFELVPEQPEIRARYAYDLAQQGRFDEAVKLAETLAFNPHGGNQGEVLLERIKAMRDRKQAPPVDQDKIAG